MRVALSLLCVVFLACAPASELEGTWAARTVHDAALDEQMDWWFTLTSGNGEGALSGEGAFQYADASDEEAVDNACEVTVSRSGGAWAFSFTFDRFDPLDLMCCLGCGGEEDPDVLTCSPDEDQGEGVYVFDRSE